MVALVLPLSFHDPRFWALNAVASSLYRWSSTPSSSVVKTFLALPSYSRSSAILQPPSQFLYPARHHAQVAQGVVRVEESVQLVSETLANLFVPLQKFPEVVVILPGLHRRPLHHPVRVVAAHAALHEGEQDAAGENDATPTVQVFDHAFLVYLEAAQDARRRAEHVESQNSGVGQNDALGRGVGDIPLLPQGVVLEADRGVRPHYAGHAAQALGQNRVPLVRHRRRALLTASERLGQFPDFRALGPPDLQGYLLHGRTQDGERSENLRVPVPLHHLGRGRR